MFKLSKKIVCYLMLISLLISLSCQSPKVENDYKVEILLFGSHPLLLSVAKGIEDGANSKLASLGSKEKIVFNKQDASFQVDQATLQTRQAILNKPNAIIALGTPSIKVALSNRNDSIPVYFGATSDPLSLKVAKTNDPNDWRKPDSFKEAPSNTFGMITDFDYSKMATLILKVAELNTSKNIPLKVGYPLNEAESNSVLAQTKLSEILADKATFIRSPVSSPADIPTATRNLVLQNIDLIQIGPDNTIAGGIGSIVSIVEGKDIPILATERESVKKGALAAYGVDFYELGKKLGEKLADNLTKNNSGSSPIEVFSQSKLYVNPEMMKKILDENSIELLAQSLEIDMSHVESVEVK